MIYTLTLNPSLDYIVSVPDFTLGKTNRTAAEQMLPGGKGINVSTVLRSLGMESTALGFAAGFVGEEILRRSAALGVHTDFIRLHRGNSRINVKLKNYDGTEINAKGPEVPAQALTQLSCRLDRLEAGDVLVLAGSIPGGLPDALYGQITEKLAGRGILCIVDAAGGQLTGVLPHRPFLIKPNRDELGALFGVTLRTRADVIPYAKRLQDMGAVNVLVSMSGEGAVLADETGVIHESPAAEGTLVNAVGAGDSMVAGFLAGWLSERSYHHAFLMGLAAGSASAFSENLASAAETERIYRELTGAQNRRAKEAEEHFLRKN